MRLAVWGALYTVGAVIDSSDTEEVDALPVLAPALPAPALATRSVAPAVQAAAVAAGGFVAGAVVVGVLGRGRRRIAAGRQAPRLRRVKRSGGDVMQIVASRSLLVDVHLLESSGRVR